jgi:hypothetical protein
VKVIVFIEENGSHNMLYDVAYYSEFIDVKVHSSNGKVRDTCPMLRLSHVSDAIDSFHNIQWGKAEI